MTKAIDAVKRKPQVKKGPAAAPGQTEQLPQGEATRLNEEIAGIPRLRQQEPGGAQEEPAGPVQYAPDERPAPYSPQGETEDILLGPTSGLPTEPGSMDAVQGLFPPVPHEVIRSLPLLAAAQKDPTLPLALKLAYKALIDRVEYELTQ